MSRANSCFSFVDVYAETDCLSGTYFMGKKLLRESIHKHVTSAKLKQYITRWEQCERVMKSLTPHERRKHFDMTSFGYKTDCGTVACAAGYCGLDPWFRKRGLRMDFVETLDKGYFEPPDNIEEFFGEDGSNGIFFDTVPRSVSVVIKEIQDHIKALKVQLADREKWTKEKR